eukprot:GILJ01024807.1.p1 GENE.GILJ01024807.1~~GILJ01024807.1.p1  ORF type:complete len:999 (+),score=132.15 GILJ01024807.1:364-2997(+)
MMAGSVSPAAGGSVLVPPLKAPPIIPHLSLRLSGFGFGGGGGMPSHRGVTPSNIQTQLSARGAAVGSAALPSARGFTTARRASAAHYTSRKPVVMIGGGPGDRSPATAVVPLGVSFASAGGYSSGALARSDSRANLISTPQYIGLPPAHPRHFYGSEHSLLDPAAPLHLGSGQLDGYTNPLQGFVTDPKAQRAVQRRQAILRQAGDIAAALMKADITALAQLFGKQVGKLASEQQPASTKQFAIPSIPAKRSEADIVAFSLQLLPTLAQSQRQLLRALLPTSPTLHLSLAQLQRDLWVLQFDQCRIAYAKVLRDSQSARKEVLQSCIMQSHLQLQHFLLSKASAGGAGRTAAVGGGGTGNSARGGNRGEHQSLFGGSITNFDDRAASPLAANLLPPTGTSKPPLFHLNLRGLNATDGITVATPTVGAPMMTSRQHILNLQPHQSLPQQVLTARGVAFSNLGGGKAVQQPLPSARGGPSTRHPMLSARGVNSVAQVAPASATPRQATTSFVFGNASFAMVASPTAQSLAPNSARRTAGSPQAGPTAATTQTPYISHFAMGSPASPHLLGGGLGPNFANAGVVDNSTPRTRQSSPRLPDYDSPRTGRQQLAHTEPYLLLMGSSVGKNLLGISPPVVPAAIVAPTMMDILATEGHMKLLLLTGPEVAASIDHIRRLCALVGIAEGVPKQVAATTPAPAPSATRRQSLFAASPLAPPPPLPSMSNTAAAAAAMKHSLVIGGFRLPLLEIGEQLVSGRAPAPTIARDSREDSSCAEGSTSVAASPLLPARRRSVMVVAPQPPNSTVPSFPTMPKPQTSSSRRGSILPLPMSVVTQISRRRDPPVPLAAPINSAIHDPISQLLPQDFNHFMFSKWNATADQYR